MLGRMNVVEQPDGAPAQGSAGAPSRVRPLNNSAVGQPELDPYVDFERDEWSRLRASTPLPLTEDDLERLRGLNEPMPLAEVEDVYLPLSRLLNLRVAATRELHAVTET